MSKKEKYKVYEYTCDLCGRTSSQDSDFWANNFNGGVCTIAEDGMNGRDSRAWEHLCRGCRKEIQDAIDAVLVKRGGEKWWERTMKATT